MFPAFRPSSTTALKDEKKDGDDFWSRLKAKMRSGETTTGTEERR
jgi:hypothetical protein